MATTVLPIVSTEWTFSGSNPNRGASKWLCPTGECKPGSRWIKADRLPPLIPRESKRWKALYRGRAAVEREFGRLKNEWALAAPLTRVRAGLPQLINPRDAREIALHRQSEGEDVMGRLRDSAERFYERFAAGDLDGRWRYSAPTARMSRRRGRRARMSGRHLPRR